MPRVHFNEKVLENLIRDFPKEFLKQDLRLVKQQPMVEGYFPDLLFQDDQSKAVIVEVQLNALDRPHLYRAIEYRHLLAKSKQYPDVRTLLVCNELPERYKDLLQIHDVGYLVISRAEVFRLAKALRPSVTLLRKKSEANQSASASRILKLLAKSPNKPNSSDPTDTLMFWQRSWSDWRDNFAFQSIDLRSLVSPAYFNSLADSPRWKKGRNKNIGCCPPNEIIISDNVLDLKASELWILTNWLSVLGLDFGKDQTEEVIFGWRGDADLYGYAEWITGHIRKYTPLLNHYGTDIGYDNAKIQSDLEKFSRICLYSGKYGEHVAMPVLKSISVENGPGSLAPKWEERKKFLSPDRIKDAEYFAARSNWTTVKFAKTSSHYNALRSRVLRAPDNRALGLRN